MPINKSCAILDNFIQIIGSELDICGCIELNHEFLRKVGYYDVREKDMPEFVDMIGKALKGYNIIVNENGDSPRYFVSGRLFRDGKTSCDNCRVLKECSTVGPIETAGDKLRSNHNYVMRCKYCTMYPCPVVGPDVRKLY